MNSSGCPARKEGRCAQKPLGTDHFLDRSGKPFFPHEQDYAVVGAPGRAPFRPASFRGNRIGPPDEKPFPPMPFLCNALPSRLQANFFAEKNNNRGEQKGNEKALALRLFSYLRSGFQIKKRFEVIRGFRLFFQPSPRYW